MQKKEENTKCQNYQILQNQMQVFHPNPLTLKTYKSIQNDKNQSSGE